MRAALAPLAVLLVAGCVSVAPAEVASPADPTAAAPPSALDLQGAGCWVGGGHSVLPKWDFVLPAPWEAADILEDVGPQPAYSSGVSDDWTRPVPSEGRTMGNWHATMVCDSWTLRGVGKPGALVGFVGARVEPPPFDAGPPADRHYLVTVVASDDADVRAAFVEGGVAAMEATHARDDAPGPLVRIRMWTDANGNYDSLFRAREFGAMEAGRMRLWFQGGSEGHAHADPDLPEWRIEGEFRPLAVDLVAEGGKHFVADVNGYFSHSGTAHHAPLPGAYGNTAALLYEGLDADLSWGPRPDVVLVEGYAH